jgi:hypothetical protein
MYTKLWCETPGKEYTALKNRSKDNVKEHIMEVEWEFVDWIHVA